MTDRDALVAVLREARERVQASGVDAYDWSSWRDRAHALEELDDVIGQLTAGEDAAFTIAVIFAPTGPLQEVSLAAGWGEAFLDLAARADAALGG